MAALSFGTAGVAFLVAYQGGAEILAKVVSSPQTAELNIRKREPTLMKWVHIGQIETAAVIVIAATIEKGNVQTRNAILVGGFLGMIVSELEYLYAKKSGKNNPGPETEEYPEEQNAVQVYS